MLALQLVEGRPELILEGSRGSLKLQVDTVLKSGTWHTLHLHLDAQVCLDTLLSPHVCVMMNMNYLMKYRISN